jgi:hypothetical protein
MSAWADVLLVLVAVGCACAFVALWVGISRWQAKLYRERESWDRNHGHADLSTVLIALAVSIVVLAVWAAFIR